MPSFQSHPIPADLEAAKALSSSPAVLDLYMWLSYRCSAARGEERVPLFGDFALVNQLGSATYARPRKFRERLERWLDLVRMMWPECPALISLDGRVIIVKRITTVCHAISESESLRDVNPVVDGLLAVLTDQIKAVGVHNPVWTAWNSDGNFALEWPKAQVMYLTGDYCAEPRFRKSRSQKGRRF